MSEKYIKLKDDSGDILYPQTQKELVNGLQAELDTKQNNLPTTSTAGKVLKSTATAGTVEWGDPAATGVTSITAGTGLTGGTITTSGTIAVDTSTIATVSYVDGHHDSTKQDTISDLSTIRSGAALGATALQSVPSTYRTSAAQDLIDAGKQNTLTAGSNITISGNTISATDTTYTAGQNVSISNNVISATDTTYTAGENITITNNVISATGGASYTAGDGIDIVLNEISVDPDYVAIKSDIPVGTLDVNFNGTATASTQNLTNIVVGTTTYTVPQGATYSAGNGLSLSNNTFAIDTSVVATQTDLSEKQATISDLSTIRSGAALGATALQSVPTASASTLGGVKVGTGLAIDANGVLSVSLTNANTQSF